MKRGKQKTPDFSNQHDNGQSPSHVGQPRSPYISMSRASDKKRPSLTPKLIGATVVIAVAAAVFSIKLPKIREFLASQRQTIEQVHTEVESDLILPQTIEQDEMLNSIPWFEEGTGNVKIGISTNGITWNDRPYDGREYWFLPTALSTVNPPDIAICVETLTSEHACFFRAQPFGSICPDTPKCQFEIERSNLASVVALSIYDLDAEGKELIERSCEIVVGRPEVAWIEKKVTDGEPICVEKNIYRWNWIETVIFAPHETPSADVKKLSNQVRRNIKAITPVGAEDIIEGRLSGPFPIEEPQNCSLDGLFCDLNYVRVNLDLNDG